MINFKHFSKRGIRRDRNDDLSIVTGGRPIIKVGGGDQGSFKKLKRVRNYNEKLRKDFINSRENAHFKKGRHLPGPSSSSATSSDLHFTLQSPYFNNNENASTSSLIFPFDSSTSYQQTLNFGEDQQHPHNGECTIKSLPKLLKTSQSKQAVLLSYQNNRGILRSTAATQNSIYGHHGRTELMEPSSQYRSVYTGRVQKTKLASSTVNSMSVKCSGNKGSSWKICSSMPMTRMDASLVQMEMANTMSGGSIGSIAGSSSSSDFSPYSPTNQRMMQNQYGISSMFASPPPPRPTVPYSLLKGVIPPQSPLIPLTQDSAASNRSCNFSCGVQQSEWMDRSKCIRNIPTKQYSMEQIVDILCGFTTPDSIMAAQLFQPLPSAPAANIPTNFTEPQPMPNATCTFNAFSTNQSNTYQTDIFQTARTNNQSIVGNNDEDDDDGETSVYFTTTTKKKSVSFLTDNMNNICVTEHLFDPFSQDLFQSTSSGGSIADKENINPDIFNTTSNFDNVGNEISFPTLSPVPLFELDGSNSVGLVRKSSEKNPNLNNSITNVQNSSLFGEAQTRKQTETTEISGGNDLFSDILQSFDLNSISNSDSCFSSRDLEKIHPSWDPFLNDLCSESELQNAHS